MIESIKKLRIDLQTCETTGSCPTIAAMARYADEIEAEIAERYIELPMDADGVPIHVGDSIEYPNGGRDVVRFITVNDNMPTFNEMGWIASKCRHVKKQDIEDVLERFIEDYDHWDEFAHFERGESRNALFARYADEIRKAVGE